MLARPIQSGDSFPESMAQFHWDPDSYLALMHDEVPDYERLHAWRLTDPLPAGPFDAVFSAVLVGEAARPR
jgi:hypothetical protein